MALTNAERQRKHREKVSKTLKKVTNNPLHTYVDLLDSYLDSLTLTDYQEILDLGFLHFDPDFISTFDEEEKHFLLTAVKIACRDRLQKVSSHD
jgi:hypothetical protein